MPSFSFSKWSPGGNTTVFLPMAGESATVQANLARQVLAPDILGGEQAGFVDLEKHSLRMAGGEFCCNACRAFGALLAHEKGKQEGSLYVECSGWPSPVELDVMGTSPSYTVAATLELPNSVAVHDLGDRVLVFLPGIVHVLLNAAQHRVPAKSDMARATDIIEQFSAQFGLEKAPCVGAIWWRWQGGDDVDMTPLVHVRAVRTTFFESACGSGALALGLWLAKQVQGKGTFCIGQPSGDPLYVDILQWGTKARISGPVNLLAQGQVWLDS